MIHFGMAADMWNVPIPLDAGAAVFVLHFLLGGQQEICAAGHLEVQGARRRKGQVANVLNSPGLQAQ